jgi:hypothetical protein
LAADDRPHVSLEGILTALRAQLDGSFRSATEEIVRGLAAERDRAVAAAAADVRRQAQEQLAQLREATKRQSEETRAASEAQLAELRGKLEELRQTTEQQIETAKRNLDAEVAEVRSRAEAEVEEARRDADTRLQTLERTSTERISHLERDLVASRVELEAERNRQTQARESIEQELRVERERFDQANQITRMELDAERVRAEQARMDLDAERARAEQARAAVHQLERDVQQERLQLERLRQEREKEAQRAVQASLVPPPMRDMVEATRALDAARSLREVLDQLLDYSARCAERSVLLFVKGERLDSWRARGFDAGTLHSIETRSADAGIAGAAVREGRTMTGSGDRPLPVFAGGGDRHAVAIPITVGDVVVAVLYADDATPSPVPDPRSPIPEWALSLEVVARHASRVLETTTVHQAANLVGSQPMARPSQSKSGSRTSEPRRFGNVQ